MTLISSAKNPVATLLLAHGAGAPMDSPFMESLAEALADRGIQVVRFEFPYMQRRREEQRKFPPNRAPQLLEAFARQVASVERSGLPLWVGGKSMGGRMASMLAAEGASERRVRVPGREGVCLVSRAGHGARHPRNLASIWTRGPAREG